MTATPSPLLQIDTSLFLDPHALNLVRFEVDGLDTTAHMKFKDGSSETVHGETARNLHQRLTGIENPGEGGPTTAAQTENGSLAPGPSRVLTVNVSSTDMDLRLLGRNKAWFYRKNANGRNLILAFVNAKGSCSMRPFDAATSLALGKSYGSGPYQKKFAELIEGAIELIVESQPNLERDCKQRLPEELFARLREQIEMSV